MSHSTHTERLVITRDEIMDLLINGEESIVTLNNSITATLSNATGHRSYKVGKKAAHQLNAMLVMGEEEHDAEIRLVERSEDSTFVGTAIYNVFHGGLMAD